jgi:MtN3 and saliva related transmembrane protein
MNSLDFIGYTAGFLVVFSLLPQFIKSWKTKSTKDISLWRYMIYILGIVLWLVYGTILSNGPMIASNVVALTFASSILYLKLKYG